VPIHSPRSVLVTRNKPNKFLLITSAIPAVLVPAPRVLHCDRVNGLPK
jgi:hypothetical protein